MTQQEHDYILSRQPVVKLSRIDGKVGYGMEIDAEEKMGDDSKNVADAVAVGPAADIDHAHLAERYKAFGDELIQLGFTIEEVATDDLNLFKALSMALFGHDRRHTIIKDQCLKHLANQKVTDLTVLTAIAAIREIHIEVYEFTKGKRVFFAHLFAHFIQ